MGVFNDRIKSVDQGQSKWTGSSYTTKAFRDDTDDPFQYNLNYSKNKLDNQKGPEFYNKFSHTYYINHRNDNIGHTGYNFLGNVLTNSLSKIFFIEDKRDGILMKLERCINFMIDSVKTIKKSYNWTLEKSWRNFN